MASQLPIVAPDEIVAVIVTGPPEAVSSENPDPLMVTEELLGPSDGVSAIAGVVTVNGRFSRSMPVPGVMPSLPA